MYIYNNSTIEKDHTFINYHKNTDKLEKCSCLWWGFNKGLRTGQKRLKAKDACIICTLTRVFLNYE